ncbi:MAG: hypothetical protein EOO46_18545 [Flavobacterium sp.]|nr:MAG: hypothetical protein EOO46_18545 [Flavobacterium sp.]
MIKLHIIFLCICFVTKGQEFKKSHLTNTEWFANNKDSAYFKNDTIKLIRYIHKSEQQFKNAQTEYDESEYKYLNHLVYVRLGFKSNTNFTFTEHNWSFATGRPDGKLIWDFDRKRRMIMIYENQAILQKFKVISFGEIELESDKTNQILKSEELIIVKIP